MRFLGGKAQIAQDLAAYLTIHEGDTYIEPFLGGAGVFERVAPHYDTAIGSDLHEDLILMWQAVMDGWVPPLSVSEEEYERQRNAGPSALRGFVGYGLSYNGMWFQRYDPHRPSRVTAAVSSARAIVATGNRLRRHTILRCDYREHTDRMRPGVVVYCDPPYRDTGAYKGVEEFDHDQFWATMDRWVRLGATVLVSEYEAPGHWRQVWQKQRRLLTRAYNGETRTVTERLFTRA